MSKSKHGKLRPIIAVAALAFCLLACMTACDETPQTPSHTSHNFGEWITVAPATCTSDGTMQRICTECDYEEKDTIPQLIHNYLNNVCEYCGKASGLSFDYNSDTDSYSVTEYTGNANTPSIPSTYNDKPVTSIGAAAFEDCNCLTSITIPDSVTSIGENAFYECRSLTTITIPESVTNIGENAFYGTAWYNNQSEGLIYAGKVAYKYKGIMPDNTSITVKDGTIIITSQAFAFCSGLTSITIPNSVTSIGDSAFSWCNSLTSITIPDSVTSIGVNTFNVCSSLTSITIPDSVTSIGDYAFNGCSSLMSITIPDSVTSIGDYAFWGCSSLTSVTIPNSVTSIGDYAFQYCSGLTSITIGNGVTNIGDSAFAGCNRLTSITIGNGVIRIGVSALSWCWRLTSITIPNSVTSIGSYAFIDCTGLTSIIFEGTMAQWLAIEKDSSWHYDTDKFTIHCTDGDLDEHGNEI